MKRILVWMLLVALVFTMLPGAVLAVDDPAAAEETEIFEPVAEPEEPDQPDPPETTEEPEALNIKNIVALKIDGVNDAIKEKNIKNMLVIK